MGPIRTLAELWDEAERMGVSPAALLASLPSPQP